MAQFLFSFPQVVPPICQNEGLYYPPPSDPKREVNVQKVALEEKRSRRERGLVIAGEWMTAEHFGKSRPLSRFDTTKMLELDLLNLIYLL